MELITKDQRKLKYRFNSIDDAMRAVELINKKVIAPSSGTAFNFAELYALNQSRAIMILKIKQLDEIIDSEFKRMIRTDCTEFRQL